MRRFFFFSLFSFLLSLISSLLSLKKGGDMGKEYTSDLSERLFRFSVDVIRLLGETERKKEFDVIRHQLCKAATSIGANYEESQSTTRREFPSKIRICVREALEARYWQRIVLALGVLNKSRVELLLRENEEIIKILKSILRKTSNITIPYE